MTIEDIAGGLELHRNTVRKFLKGKNIDPATALKVADAIGEDVTEIAEFVEGHNWKP
jgi:plasmid maintenance system antidote protein VapI